jgi:hypothetical protein
MNRAYSSISSNNSNNTQVLVDVSFIFGHGLCMPRDDEEDSVVVRDEADGEERKDFGHRDVVGAFEQFHLDLPNTPFLGMYLSYNQRFLQCQIQ